MKTGSLLPPYQPSEYPGSEVKATDLDGLRHPWVRTYFHNRSMAVVSTTDKLLQKPGGYEIIMYQWSYEYFRLESEQKRKGNLSIFTYRSVRGGCET